MSSNKKQTTIAGELAPIDMNFCPSWYADDPADKVRGTLRREALGQLGVAEMVEDGADWALSPSLTAEQKSMVFNLLGPAQLSGEDLPELSEGSIELCRIQLLGTVHEEVTVVYACPADDWVSEQIFVLEDQMGYEPDEDWDVERGPDYLDPYPDEDSEPVPPGEYEEDYERVEYLERRLAIEENAGGTGYQIYIVDEVGMNSDADEDISLESTNIPWSMAELVRYLDVTDWWSTGYGVVVGALIHYN